MTERVHPKAAAAAANINPTADGQFPSTKSQLYGASRPPYRPQPGNRRRRHPCCSICIWITAIVASLLILFIIASAIVYFIYRPHRPSFTVSALKVSSFKFTPSSQLNSKFDLNLTAINPNKKVKFIYNSFSVAVLSNGVDVGDGSFPEFVHEKRNTTEMKMTIARSVGEKLDGESVDALKIAAKSKLGFPLEVKMETKVKVKIGWLKMPKVGFRVFCDGITARVPAGKKTAVQAPAEILNAKCKGVFRMKIWKWTI